MSVLRVSIFSALVCSSLVFAACGGGGDDSSNNDTSTTDDVILPDARPTADATPDSSTTAGLGQICNPAMHDADCPTAMNCLFFTMGATKGYCAPVCLQGATGMTNADRQFSTLTPPPDDSVCVAAFTGAATPACAVVEAVTPTPTDGKLAPNTAYTQIQFGCALLCGAYTDNAGMPKDYGTCPTGLTCAQNFCNP